MSQLRRAWKAYHRGDYTEAARLFDQAAPPAGPIGKALSLVEAGRGDEATSVVNQHLGQSPDDDLEALLADIQGRQGRRTDAQQLLEELTDRHGDGGFYRTLLGEQRIRLGRWQQGCDDFVAGLQNDDPRAVAHLRKVLTDMIDAVAAGRIPVDDAQKFINRVDYSLSEQRGELTEVFAEARRALNNNRRMDRSELVEPWSVGADSTASRPTDGPPQAPPADRSPPPEASGGPPPTPSRSSSSNSSSPPPGEDVRQQLTEGPNRAAQPDDQAIDAKQKNMAAVMKNERRENEQLQQLTDDVDPPIWPSRHEAIDTIEQIGFSDSTILKGSNSIDTANFRITGGNIGVEILLERCMHNLMAAARSGESTTLRLIRASIPRLELNLLDGFSDDIPGPGTNYHDDIEIDRPDLLGVGRFIGECIVRSYGGSWDYQIPPEDSVIKLGDYTLKPFELAEQFFEADDFDDVDFQVLIHQAEEAVETSTSLPNFTEHIDPTAGLVEDALGGALAEQWVQYRFALTDDQLQDVADSIEVLEENDDFIAFAITVAYVPARLGAAIGGSTDGDGNVRMAYMRDSGEFLVLSSNKHFGRFLEQTSTPLDRNSGPAVADWLQQLFRPGWEVVTDQQTADALGDRFQTDVDGPGLRRSGTTTELRVPALDDQSVLRNIDIRHTPGDAPPYTVEIND